ncbi:hypothetical protein H4R18_000777 [Coemansia javaensis]|uniref:Uncharacterized protein n=1 Tax=Coemansia javaensis TaxID=2761396 RepID=A0A9W8HGY7_9FUNG|nr:hypothetical protein H4R18_000777 [Coemansia javaensis]
MRWWWKSDEYSVAGRTVLVTGAAGAIGRRLAERLVACGARVALADIAGAEEGAALCAALDAAAGGGGVRAAAYRQTDLRDGAQIEQMVRWAEGEFGGRVDVLVNNAGLASPHGLYAGETFEGLARLVQVNLVAPMEATRVFAQRTRAAGRTGCVVLNVASLGGLLPNEGGEAYGAAKAAMIQLTRASRALMPHVRVAAIAPYYVDTPMVRSNPKLQNNPTVHESLMLSVDQVCDAAIRCIQDPASAGNTYALIGSCTYLRMWLYDYTALHVRAAAAWSLLVAAACRLLGRG